MIKSTLVVIFFINTYACLYLPETLENIYSELQDNHQMHENDQSTVRPIKQSDFSTPIPLADKKDTEEIIERVIKRIEKLIPSPVLKTTYQELIELFPPGTIGGSITIIVKEIVSLLWKCIQKRLQAATTNQ